MLIKWGVVMGVQCSRQQTLKLRVLPLAEQPKDKPADDVENMNRFFVVGVSLDGQVMTPLTPLPLGSTLLHINAFREAISEGFLGQGPEKGRLRQMLAAVYQQKEKAVRLQEQEGREVFFFVLLELLQWISPPACERHCIPGHSVGIFLVQHFFLSYYPRKSG